MEASASSGIHLVGEALPLRGEAVPLRGEAVPLRGEEQGDLTGEVSSPF